MGRGEKGMPVVAAWKMGREGAGEKDVCSWTRRSAEQQVRGWKASDVLAACHRWIVGNVEMSGIQTVSNVQSGETAEEAVARLGQSARTKLELVDVVVGAIEKAILLLPPRRGSPPLPRNDDYGSTVIRHNSFDSNGRCAHESSIIRDAVASSSPSWWRSFVFPDALEHLQQQHEGIASGIFAIKRTYQPSTLKRKRTHGFLTRNRISKRTETGGGESIFTIASGGGRTGGRKIIDRRRRKGRWRLAC